MVMRLIHLTNIPTPYRVAFCNLLADKLSSKGWELIVIYASWTEPRRSWKIDQNQLDYKWYNLDSLVIDVRGFILRLDVKLLFLLLCLNGDILLSSGSWNMPAALLASLPLPRFPKYKIFWSEGHAESVIHPKGLVRLLRRKSLSLYDCFAVPNESSQNFIVDELCAGVRSKTLRFISLPNVIDEPIFMNSNALFSSDIPKNLAIVAALEKRKGWLQLIHSLSLIPRDVRGMFRLHICGVGELDSLITISMAQMDIECIFYGQLDSVSVAKVLSSSHGFLLPSLTDPNPLSVIEALCVGLPLLISGRCGNASDCVHSGINGWIFDPLKPREMASTIGNWVSSDCNTLISMGIESKRIYNESFRSSAVVDRFCAQLVSNI